LLSKLFFEIKFYGLCDLCVICEDPHPLINMEDYIPNKQYPLSHLPKNLTRIRISHTLESEEGRVT